MKRSVHVRGLEHVAPIPTAAQVGPLVATSAISGQGVGADTNRSLDEQVEHVFASIVAIAEAANCGVADIVRVTFTVGERAVKSAIDVRWRALFPHEDDRPARHVVVGTLPGGVLLQAEFIAYRATQAGS